MSNNSTESIVRDSLPHIEEPSSWEFGRILTVILCFIVGVCGHSSLCGLIVFFRESHSNFNQKRRLRVGETATRSCILAICFANFLHLLAKVLHVLDILFVDIWVFGQTFCKIFQFCSEIYILSGFLVAFLVLDRFISTNCCPRLPIFWPTPFQQVQFANFTGNVASRHRFSSSVSASFQNHSIEHTYFWFWNRSRKKQTADLLYWWEQNFSFSLSRHSEIPTFISAANFFYTDFWSTTCKITFARLESYE